MNKKQLSLVILIAFFVGALGSIFFGRVFIPYLATIKGWEGLNKLVTSSPIVINRTQEVQLNEGVNLIDLAKQASNFTVTIYSTEPSPSFLGSGLIMTSDGLIFASKSSLGSRSQLSVVLSNGSVYPGLVRAVDPKSDIAAITISEKNLSTVSFADSVGLQAGQRLLVLGQSQTPFDRNLAQGYVTNTVLNTLSQLSRNYTTEVLENSFETDAVVNNGRFFGSPIINLQGKVVGMVAGTTIQNIVIAENLQSALTSYLSSGKITRPRLGLSYFNLSENTAALRKLSRTGVLVAKADDGTPSAGKLLANDLIFQVDGQNIDNQSFEQIVNRHSIGEIKFMVLRNQKEIEIIVNLEATK